MSAARNAIIKAKIENVITELMVKTDAANVYVDDTTTLATKLSSIIADIATKASTEELTDGLAGKSDVGHRHSLADMKEATVDSATTDIISTYTVNSDVDNISIPDSHLGSTTDASSVVFRIDKDFSTQTYTSKGGATYDPVNGKYTLVVTSVDQETYTLTENVTDESIHFEPVIPSGSTISLRMNTSRPVIKDSNISSSIARKTDLTAKADVSHTHAQSDITGLTDALALLASKTEVTSAIDGLRQEMLGDTPVEAYNTFTELAAYIAAHKEVSDALTAAIGTKADKATTLTGYGITDAYTKNEVDNKISDAISSATGGESAASVKAALEAYETSNDARVDALEADTHTHSNKTVLDGITSDAVTSWNGKANVYYTSTEPANLTANDLWIQLV